MIEGFEAACADRTETFRRPDAETAQCWVYLPPDVTAALILTHGGTYEDLPQLVLQLRVIRQTDQLYRADLENYINVPRTKGSDLRVAYKDQTTLRSISRMLDDLGGKPIIE
ncbi:hypothetical protein [Ruegeria aquimaris]|uniref:Uncharacterized protein n=1 Tax=Ruegeria aquimaris TaxID=2984333 RepID=A0ABT3AML2_9RHOB|nr:hypothetical protein [Ruegeria sp. XHP0148]MCV2889925.1 hypothetical protein [Ruegeria sp. XHP0148]